MQGATAQKKKIDKPSAASTPVTGAITRSAKRKRLARSISPKKSRQRRSMSTSSKDDMESENTLEEDDEEYASPAAQPIEVFMANMTKQMAIMNSNIANMNGNIRETVAEAVEPIKLSLIHI